MASAYASASHVAPLCFNILNGASNFSASTQPPLSFVNTKLQDVYDDINSNLNGCGYTTPVASTANYFGKLRDLSIWYAAARVEFTRINLTLSPDERTRAQVFQDMYDEGAAKLCVGDLSLAGLDRTSQGTLFVGGTKKSDKDVQVSNSDRVAPAFHRGMQRWPGTRPPTDSTSGS
ncbi:MAG: hypothetical protein ACXABY_13215 [Candidatus Thorarchaeota archaeon]|jgi:hypothetical protein